MTLPFYVSRCARCDAESEQPFEEDDWEEFDPAPLESWIFSDFDWEIEESYPKRGDFWDDSLDRESDLAAAAMTDDETRVTNVAAVTR